MLRFLFLWSLSFSLFMLLMLYALSVIRIRATLAPARVGALALVPLVVATATLIAAACPVAILGAHIGTVGLILDDFLLLALPPVLLAVGVWLALPLLTSWLLPFLLACSLLPPLLLQRWFSMKR